MLNGEEMLMILKKSLALGAVALLIASFSVEGFGQGRGKAELKAPAGNITVDYGRPSVKGEAVSGKEPLSVPFPMPGDFWRMGNDTSTTFATPIDLTFGNLKVPKGSYSLWLHKSAPDKFELVFNSQTGKWGTEHDASKDLYKVPMTLAKLPNTVEVFTIDLKPAPKGGIFELSWGTSKLSAPIQY